MTAVSFAKNQINPGVAGLSISYSLMISGCLGLFLQCFIVVENSMDSAVKIIDYCYDIPKETNSAISNQLNLSDSWPLAGHISFDQVSLRYAPHLPDIIRNITLELKGGTKAGIVGRTGAGKSTMMLSLFRMIEPSTGVIKIDGIDLQHIGLSKLRSSLSIIPQESVLFEGTLRYNLDPYHIYTDNEVISALKSAALQDLVSSSYEGSIYEKVSENGSNFSIGQRGQFCVARSILKRPKVLVMDEGLS